MYNKAVVIFLTLTVMAYSAEISSSYALLEKSASFKPDINTETVETHAVFKKDSKSEAVKHPIYRAEEHKNEGRARIEPVRPTGPIVKHEMLADQPVSTEVNRIDNVAIPNYGFVPVPSEVAYPDIPYAPAYGYDGYGGSNGYDVYGNGPNNYMMEPDTSALSLLWSQAPISRTIVTYVGSTIAWVFNSIFVILLGSFLTIGICSYTNLCSISFHGVGPIHEEMRSLVTPERLEKISNAADFVKNAIDKYQKIQKVTDVVEGKRSRRAILF